MTRARSILATVAALTVLATAGASRAQQPPVGEGAPSVAPLPRHDEDAARPRHASRVYPTMQVVGASVFGLSYGWSLIGALLLPGPNTPPQQKEIATRLLVPVVGPWWATADAQSARVVTIPLGIMQASGAVVFAWGTIGGALEDDGDEHADSAFTVVPLSPDGTMPGLGVVGRF